MADRNKIAYPGLIIVAIVAIIEFALIGYLFPGMPQFAWGGAVAALMGYTIGAYAYGNRNSPGKYEYNLLTGLVVSLFTLALNFYIPFGSDLANLIGSNDPAGYFAFFLVLGTVFMMLYVGLSNTKHTDLKTAA